MEELLSAYYDQELDDDRKSMVEAHLRECVNCQKSFLYLQEIRAGIRSVAAYDLSLMFSANVMRMIRRQKDEEGPWFSAVSMGKRLVWSLGVLSVIIVGASALNQPETTVRPEMYFTGEPDDSSITRSLLQNEEISKDDVIIAALVD
jgi:anti-sigma factor RsiW